MDDDDGKLDVGDLVPHVRGLGGRDPEARGKSERDRDYFDDIQHTAEEIAKLEKRGQPVVTDNRIKTKIDFLVGLEKQQRIDPRALPRTPKHEEDADGATRRCVTSPTPRTTTTSAPASGATCWWRAPAASASMSSRVASSGYGQGEMEIKIDYVAWDRMFWDPHSSEPDFSDAGYLGIVIWMDFADALAKYPDGKEALDTTMASATHTDTYDDKPKFSPGPTRSASAFASARCGSSVTTGGTSPSSPRAAS